MSWLCVSAARGRREVSPVKGSLLSPVLARLVVVNVAHESIARLALGRIFRIDADVDDDAARLEPCAAHELGLADRGDDDVGAAHLSGLRRWRRLTNLSCEDCEEAMISSMSRWHWISVRSLLTMSRVRE